MPNEKRKTSSQRGYGSKWQAARASFLAANPECVLCRRIGISTRADVVDHVVPHKGNAKLFWDRNNWQPLCRACHDRHKQGQEHGRIDTGCDANGLPIDPGHHWHRGGG